MPSFGHISKVLASVVITGAVAATLSSCGAEAQLPESFEPVTFGIHLVRAESDSAAAMKAASETDRVPPGAKYFTQQGGDGLIVDITSDINQDCLKAASEGIHPEGGHSILNFSLDEDCTKIFGKLTSENIGKRFAVVINDEIISAPRINGAITGGSGFIEGSFTPAEVKALSKQLNQTITYNKRK